jgi:hypothetical protein
MDETFTADEFNLLFADSTSGTQRFLGQFSDCIDDVHLKAFCAKPEGDDYDPLPLLKEIGTAAGLDPLLYQAIDGYGHSFTMLELPGCSTSVRKLDPPDSKTKETAADGNVPPEGPQRWFQIRVVLTPDLFHLNAPLLDKWYVEAGFRHDYSASIEFKSGIVDEERRHLLTTKLYKTGIRLFDAHSFEFEKLCFKCSRLTFHEGSHVRCSLDFACTGNLSDGRLRQIIDRLFESEVLYIRTVE